MRSCLDPFTYGKKARCSEIRYWLESLASTEKKLGVTWTIAGAARPSHSFCAQRAWRSRPLVLSLRTARRRGFQPGQGPPAHVGVYATWLVPDPLGPHLLIGLFFIVGHATET